MNGSLLQSMLQVQVSLSGSSLSSLSGVYHPTSPWPAMASPVRPVSTLGFPITMLIPSSGPPLSSPPQTLSLPDDQNHIHPSKHKGRQNFPLAAFPSLSSGDADGHPHLILLSFWGLLLARCFLSQLLAGSSHAHVSIPPRMPRLEQQ